MAVRIWGILSRWPITWCFSQAPTCVIPSQNWNDRYAKFIINGCGCFLSLFLLLFFLVFFSSSFSSCYSSCFCSCCCYCCCCCCCGCCCCCCGGGCRCLRRRRCSSCAVGKKRMNVFLEHTSPDNSTGHDYPTPPHSRNVGLIHLVGWCWHRKQNVFFFLHFLFQRLLYLCLIEPRQSLRANLIVQNAIGKSCLEKRTSSLTQLQWFGMWVCKYSNKIIRKMNSIEACIRNTLNCNDLYVYI